MLTCSSLPAAMCALAATSSCNAAALRPVQRRSLALGLGLGPASSPRRQRAGGRFVRGPLRVAAASGSEDELPANQAAPDEQPAAPSLQSRLLAVLRNALPPFLLINMSLQLLLMLLATDAMWALTTSNLDAGSSSFSVRCRCLPCRIIFSRWRCCSTWRQCSTAGSSPPLLQ